jgi:protein ImuA
MKNKQEIIRQLRQDILRQEGYRQPLAGTSETVGLGPVEAAFPHGIFPLGTIHELVCGNTEQATACAGFVSGLLSSLMKNGGACLWVSVSGNLFPCAFKAFGIEPDRIIFVHLTKDKDALWVMDEALKCEGITAVVGELNELNFKQSRRLQLAVEQSRITGFILRNRLANLGSTACAARWEIKSLPSETVDDLPGLGFPRWEVELSRVRNGKPGKWIIEWSEGKFRQVQKHVLEEQQQMAG